MLAHAQPVVLSGSARSACHRSAPASRTLRAKASPRRSCPEGAFCSRCRVPSSVCSNAAPVRTPVAASLHQEEPAQPRAAADGARSRRALFGAAAAAAALQTVSPARAADAEESSEGTPLAVKAAKLGGILFLADVVSGLILGRSVLNLAKKDGDKSGDWKEKVADSLMGAKGATPEAAAPDAAAAAPAASGNSTRVDGLLARVRGLRFNSGLRFKEDVIDVIDSAYEYAPTTYRTGFDTPWEVVNPAGKNEGSCKTFFFAQMHGLDPKETVALFAEYALEVEATPQGSSHANIRSFQRTGWKAVKFDGTVLTPKGAK